MRLLRIQTLRYLVIGGDNVNLLVNGKKKPFGIMFKARREGGGVLSYVTLTGTCGPIGYGLQGVLS